MSIKLSDADLYRVYLDWKDVTGPFRCFFRSPNFVSLKHYPDFERVPVQLEIKGIHERILEAVDSFEKENTLIFLDIPGEEVLEAAFLLNREKGTNPVLTFNNVLHKNGLIGSQKFISNLIGYSGMLGKNDSNRWLFAMDHQRYGDYSDDELRQHFNNQYELTEEDLPPFEMLKDLKLERVVYIFSGPAMEDMENYLEYLKNSGFPVLKVDLEN